VIIDYYRYFKIKINVYFKVDVLLWWKERTNSMPLLAELARGYLAIPASSSSSERMFSASGAIVSSSRQNLNPETASALTYIQQNFDRVKVRIWELKSSEDKQEDEAAAVESEGSQHSQSQQSTSSQPQKQPMMITPKPKTRRLEESLDLFEDID